MRATSSSYVGADLAGTTPSLRGERAVHDLALAAQVRDERAVVDDLGRAGVAAPEADLPAGEDGGLAVLVDAPGARDVGAVDRRQQPRVAAAHEHVHDGGRVADDDVPGLLDDAAGGVARHDPEGLRSRREVVARGEAAIRIHAHRDVVDLEAGDRTIDPSAHLHRRVRERGAVRRLLDDELRRWTGRGRRRDLESHVARDAADLARGVAHRLERARRLGLAAALLVEEDDELVGLQVEILRVVAQEALRIDGAGERLIVPVFERLEELFADARVGGGLVERDPLLLTLRP